MAPVFLADRMSRLGTESAFEVLARAKALEAAGSPVIHLEIGEPDFPTAPHIVDAAIEAMRAGQASRSRCARTTSSASTLPSSSG